MGLRDMMDRMGRGLKGKKPAEQGPLGEAIEVLISIMKEAGADVVNKSPTFKAVGVLIDSIHAHREALQAAVDMVNEFEGNLDKEWTPQRVQLLVLRINKFKLKAVSARMHQFVPKPSDPKFPGKPS